MENKGMKILIVDDEQRILETYASLLGDAGYYVRTASKAEDALLLASIEPYDIAFVDQFLGPTKGMDLIQKLSAANPYLHFVLITANGSTDLAVTAMKMGASDFISKPFFLADLLKSIEYVSKKRDLERQKKEMFDTLQTRLEEKTAELKTAYFSVLSSLAQAMEKKDIGTFGHSMRVRHYSRLIASALDLGGEEKENLKIAALLHDIGKIGTSDFILGKPGPLNETEMLDVRSHPLKGVEILKPLKPTFSQLDSILPAILHHHEYYDGSGYPTGLSGEGIPLLARIITVADTYDAIVSTRPYRAGPRTKGRSMSSGSSQGLSSTAGSWRHFSMPTQDMHSSSHQGLSGSKTRIPTSVFSLPGPFSPLSL